ncbi:tripeptidyl peptidase [Cordyceps javanica]|uniref:tripeptidyl-peptidase II n=1 Tax=Cordyceps javanica TaxID=43265 RepID=A0A545UYZ6_9HYPO|nr:tripeptidyl peptidase [Cordyceps javanica]
MSRYWPLLLLPASRFFKDQGSSPTQPFHVLKELQPAPDEWVRIGKPDSSYQFDLHVGVKQGNFAALEKRLLEISDPSHYSYGRYLSADQVNAFVAPADETIAKLHTWLGSHGIGQDQLHYSPAKDWLSISNLTVSVAESLLKTQYHIYRRDGSHVVRSEQWSLPSDVYDIIDTIHPTNAFIGIHAGSTGRPNSLKRPTGSMNDYAKDIPDGLAILNGIDLANPPLDLTPEQACNITAITPLCLRVLYGTLNYTAQATGRNKMALCNFSGEFNNRTDARQFLRTYRPDAAAAADDFAITEIAGGINRQSPSTQEEIDRGDGKEGGLDAQVLLGVGHPTPLVTYTVGGSSPPPAFAPDPSSSAAPANDNEPFLLLINWLLAQADQDLPTVLSISYADTEYTVPRSYARRVCQGFAQLGARGVSVVFGSGDWGVGRPAQCHDRAGRRRFAARFPDSCPYVTSVAATRGVGPSSVVVGFNDENHFVSGGGFSEYFARPAYQERAVSRYLRGLGGRHRGLYNAGGRAYPDVAAMGYRIVTVWNGRTKLVDGTSASAPIFAAVVALLNDARLARGKPPLGFLNPWIYSVGSQEGGGFMDIVNGSTFGCNTTGFPATQGWDAASGFGAPFWLWSPRATALVAPEPLEFHIVAPAANVIEWRDTKFTLEDHIQDLSIYSGAPSPELDRAWHDLLNSQNVRVEAEYFKHHGREKIGVAVPGSSDYIGTLNVFHELHCIKRLHQFIRFTHRVPTNLPLTGRKEHCLDFLRQSAMCHGDIGLITYIWRQDSRLPVVNSTSHQCVNWEKLYGWSRDRAVDMLKPGWLVHPTKGVVYPDGEGDRIGAIDKELDH